MAHLARSVLVPVLVAAFAVGGCGAEIQRVPTAPSSDPGAKTGAKPGPIAIQVADSQLPGKPSNLPLAAFKHLVESRAGASMTVTVVTHSAAGPSAPATDRAVIEAVRDGAFQLAVVPARAWADAGVTSLRALQAPFVLESDEQVSAVVTDEDLSARLLGGLDGTGITGLVLFPEGLRHLFGFKAPILSPADVAGRGVRMIRSGDTDAIVAALGAVPLEAEDDVFTRGVEDGAIRAAESSYALMSSSPALPIATGNVVLYAKVDTLVVNTAFWTGLTDATRAILTEAAAATRDLAIRNVADDAGAAARYCAMGGTVVAADGASLEAFRTAEAAVVQRLADDAGTSDLMAALRAVANRLPATATRACEPPIAKTIHPDGDALPDGTYRVEYTDEFLRGWDVPNVEGEHGVWTYRLDDGRWTIDQQSVDTVDHDKGIYQVKGRDLYWRWDEEPGVPIEHLTWTAAPNGDLTFAATADSPPGWTFALPLVRVAPPD